MFFTNSLRDDPLPVTAADAPNLADIEYMTVVNDDQKRENDAVVDEEEEEEEETQPQCFKRDVSISENVFETA